jgi:hypothetical protein
MREGLMKQGWLMAALVMISTPALAQSVAPSNDKGETKVRVVQEADKTVYRKKSVVDFTDVAVEGELTKPEGSYVLNKNKTTFNTLIKVRDNFVPELQKSVDNL